ncbi:NAD(P)H-binding protein [Polyangium mundeleinium]|uniref:NAD(P)H-binding protein n=1 Tax=Polyangium mundeleinium TaxID=2995306 RepID=A0ABT5F3E9_9BACT|nr:NAD(P)H-binding protein [Polyangium mundeleinium]MDC0747933.1 NAD(P)H-binding protein [Polyangium mundeleinium]
MKVLLFGATGMVGQGVLRECLLDPDVESVLVVVRSATGQKHEKLREILHEDFTNFSAIEGQLAGYDACFFCLGVSASGMKEADYHHITYDFTMAAAETLVRVSPGMTFIYVSGGGTDSTERGPWMWARVKGKTENALLRLPFKASYMFRPGYIQPRHGIVSKTRLYRIGYAIMGPLFPVWRRIAPKYMITTEDVGRAMLQVARHGADRRVLENHELGAFSQAYSRPAS